MKVTTVTRWMFPPSPPRIKVRVFKSGGGWHWEHTCPDMPGGFTRGLRFPTWQMAHDWARLHAEVCCCHASTEGGDS